MKILFAVHGNGLGHATRSHPLIDALIGRNHEVYIASSKRPMAFLRKEFGSRAAGYFDFPDYSYEDKTYTEEGFKVLNYLRNIPLYLREVSREHEETKKLFSRHGFDCIISDTKYGVHSPQVPSYLIHSHIRMTCGKAGALGLIASEIATAFLMRKYTKLLIPDNPEGGVGGKITHGMRLLGRNKYVYIGIVSMMRKMNVKQDVDYFFSISGPEPQRTVFEKKIRRSLGKLKGRVVVTLGTPEVKRAVKKGNATIYGFLGRKKQEEMFNRAKLVITRSGYSTVMDLAELGRKALLIPTRGQPEQEYLADYHDKLSHHMKRDLDCLDLESDLKKAESYEGHDCVPKTEESVKKFLEVTRL